MRPNILFLFPDQHRGDWLPFRKGEQEKTTRFRFVWIAFGVSWTGERPLPRLLPIPPFAHRQGPAWRWDNPMNSAACGTTITAARWTGRLFTVSFGTVVIR